MRTNLICPFISTAHGFLIRQSRKMKRLQIFQNRLIPFSFVYRKVWVRRSVRCFWGKKILLRKPEFGANDLAAECGKPEFSRRPVLIALDESPKLLHIDHENAKRLAEGVANLKGVSIDAEKVQTNIVIFDVSETGKTSAEICDELKRENIFAIPFGKAIRMVTHCDVSREDIETTLNSLQKIIG